MSPSRLLFACVLALLAGGCATLSPPQRQRVAEIADAARSGETDCGQPDACALPSPLRDLGDAARAGSTPQSPRHYALILDSGTDALLARINLIRSARSSIDLQTYIFDEDDASHLVLGELLAAARRGVRVRVLIDQLSALKDPRTLAALAGAHRNFRLRVYNPVFNRSRINYLQYALASACCFRRLNQRMHTKLLLVDDAVGITGGRNYQNDYYDWDPGYIFRDRDVLVAGPVASDMAANFQAFWDAPLAEPAEQLDDVGKLLLGEGVPPLQAFEYTRPARAQAMSREAGDEAEVRERLVDRALEVGAVEYLADPPRKHHAGHARAEDEEDSSHGLRGLIESARSEVLLQTPYLLLSKPAQRVFRELHRRPSPPRVVVSTNSLAATDGFLVYALTYKYKRRYLRDFGFEIHEYKPHPLDAPIDYAAAGAAPPRGSVAASRQAPAADGAAEAAPSPRVPRRDRRSVDRRSIVPLSQQRRLIGMQEHEYYPSRYFGSGSNRPVPLQHAGLRVGLHAKSMVVDDRIGVVGTNNFDPRSDDYNTEAVVVIDDPAFARELADSIRRDIAPGNAWTIAPRPKSAVFPGLEYNLAKLSERMPIFDFWPVRYSTSYDFVPGPACPRPLPPDSPRFDDCYRQVGDFPEVKLGLKGLTTRIFTAFGAGLAPIL